MRNRTIRTNEEQKELCLACLEESYNYIDDVIFLDTVYSLKNDDEFKELSWTKSTYEILYKMVEKSDSEYFEDPIGEFQSEMLEFSRRNPLTSRMFMFMYNIAAEFLEYFYVLLEEE